MVKFSSQHRFVDRVRQYKDRILKSTFDLMGIMAMGRSSATDSVVQSILKLDPERNVN